jgi:subtilisin family serine protease
MGMQNIHAQKSLQADSVQTEIFTKQWSNYTLQNPQIPSKFISNKGNECAFDGYGYNNQPQFLCTCNNLFAARTLGTQHLWAGASLGLNLSGAGINKLGIWDGGAVRTSHKELLGRVVVLDSPSTISSHSTLVAGNMMATGIIPDVRGMSYQTQLKSWNFSNDNAEIIAAAPNLLLSNHSYASTTAWQFINGNWYWYGDSALNQMRDWKYGYYDNRSRIWDSVAFQNPYYLMVKAAGNDRGSSVPPNTLHYYWNGSAWALTTTTRDTVGPYDCISTFGNAKNILTVGAVGALPNGFTSSSAINLLSFSSWGPTDDGRIKPDLVAASGSIYSTSSSHDSDYAFLGGTSMSAPNVTGSLLLLQQYHQQLKGRYMLSSSLKALAIHTATRCKPLPGPDYECGWGLPNIAKAAICLRDSVYNTLIEAQLNNADTFVQDIYYVAGDTLRVTLAYTDPKGVTAAPAYNDATLKLVNDIDLRLLNLNGNVLISPFVLNPANPAQAASTGDNFRDNVEQLYATNLPTGRYRLRLTHKGNLQANLPQKFSLILSGAPLYTPTLPVSWLSLSAKQIDWNLCEINFACAQEINNKEFKIECSGNGIDFFEVGSIPSKQSTSYVTTKYQFLHELFSKTINGTWFYRIKQIDVNNNFSYSNTISVTIYNGWMVAYVFPNPFTQDCFLTIYNDRNAKLLIELFSLTGQLKEEMRIDILAGNGVNKITLPTNNLLSGMYFLRVSEPNTSQYYFNKIIKQ